MNIDDRELARATETKTKPPFQSYICRSCNLTTRVSIKPSEAPAYKDDIYCVRCERETEHRADGGSARIR